MNFSFEKQKLLVEFLLKDPDSFTKCLKILKPEYFDDILKNIVDFVIKFSNEYHDIPSDEILNSEFPNFERINLNREQAIKQREYFINELEEFCKSKALLNAILKASENIEKGVFEGIEQSIKDALSIKLDSDIGLDYFESPSERVRRLLDNNNTITTGWKAIDKKLYGGLNRGEVTLFAGNSGEGKSLFLQNITVNWILGPLHSKKMERGLDVVYYTLELSDLLVSSRIDAMIMNRSTKENYKKVDELDIYLKNLKKAHPYIGSLTIKQMPSGITINDLRAHLKEYEIKKGKLPDAIAVDYLDLMYPTNKKINPGDLFVKDKFVSEELRSFASEKNILCVTASQLNRSAVEAEDHEISHIAGGISKVNTVDNAITIKRLIKEEKYRLKFIKTRSSSGVSQEIFLNYNPLSMRITDAEDDDEIEEVTSVSSFKKSVLMPKIVEKSISSVKNDENHKNDKENEPEEHTLNIDENNNIKEKGDNEEIYDPKQLLKKIEIETKIPTRKISNKNMKRNKELELINNIKNECLSFDNVRKSIEFLKKEI